MILKCPSCFRGIPEEPQKLSCVGGCPKETPGELLERNGIDLEVKPVFDVSRGRCPRCGVASTVEACPQCHGVIPAEWRLEPKPKVTCLALAGSRSSGKSLYIGVVKQQLELFVETRHKSVLNSLGETEQRYRERYGDRIYRERRILEATLEVATDPASALPLIFEFTAVDGVRHILVIRDVAGEDLENLRERRRRLSYLTRADAIVLLIDTLKIEEIRSVLRGRVEEKELGQDGVEVLRALIEFLKEGEGRLKTSTPIAVTLSKVDYLHSVTDSNNSLRPLMARPGSPLQRDPSMSEPGFDAKDGDLLHLEMDSLFQYLMGQRLGNVLRQSVDKYQFFAVSTLGADTRGENLSAFGIAPFRVLDPLKWIMEL